jgi:hypothetical protein
MLHADENWFVAIFEGLLVFFVLSKIFQAKGGRVPFIRRIPGLTAIDEALGRATEMGRPILMVPGLSSGGLNIVALAALQIFSHITKTAAKFATPIRLCVADPAVYAIGQEVIQDAYHQEGKEENYDPDSVQFVSSEQFPFAAAVSGIILRQQVAATFFLGDFFAESLIFAETANTIGAIQVAGTTQITQTPFFVAACDYVIIGDEFYAASAYLSREPVAVGSLVGQDYGKLLFASFVVIGCVWYTIVGPQARGSEPAIVSLFKSGGWDIFLHSLGIR